MKWVELSLTAESEARAERVIAILGQFGEGGAAVDEALEPSPGQECFTVRIYLPRDGALSGKRRRLVARLLESGLVAGSLRERRIEPEEWQSAWKKYFGILEVGKRLIIKPSWLETPAYPREKLVIEIDPGMAFGTGLHATTRLCLRRLEKHLKSGETALDLGTGSGILAIAAARLGAAAVLALDTDPLAVRVAQENIIANGVTGTVRVEKGTLSPSRQNKLRQHFDLVVANITSRVLGDLAAAFARVLRPEGWLIVSGISAPGLDEVLIRLALAGFTLEALDSEGDWYALVARAGAKAAPEISSGGRPV